MDSGVLSQPALVLNRSWCAIATISVRRALQLLCKGAAKAIRPGTYEVHEFSSWAELAVPPEGPYISTVRLRIPVPEIIILTRFNGIPRTKVVFNRRNLFRRDKSTCQYCGKRAPTSELSIDHVMPRSRGGEASWENCVLACLRCNRRKANRLPEEANMKLLRPPERPRWAPFLEISVTRRCESWETFLSERYWDVALE